MMLKTAVAIRLLANAAMGDLSFSLIFTKKPPKIPAKLPSALDIKEKIINNGLFVVALNTTPIIIAAMLFAVDDS